MPVFAFDLVDPTRSTLEAYGTELASDEGIGSFQLRTASGTSIIVWKISDYRKNPLTVCKQSERKLFVHYNTATLEMKLCRTNHSEESCYSH
jgi:hypothetical protein